MQTNFNLPRNLNLALRDELVSLHQQDSRNKAILNFLVSQPEKMVAFLEATFDDDPYLESHQRLTQKIFRRLEDSFDTLANGPRERVCAFVSRFYQQASHFLISKYGDNSGELENQFPLMTRGQTINVNKLLLCSASPFLDRFIHNMRFNSLGIDRFNPKTIELLIQYLATGTLPTITDCEVYVDLFVLAHEWDLKGLLAKLESLAFITPELNTVESILYIYQAAHQMNSPFTRIIENSLRNYSDYFVDILDFSINGKLESLENRVKLEMLAYLAANYTELYESSSSDSEVTLLGKQYHELLQSQKCPDFKNAVLNPIKMAVLFKIYPNEITKINLEDISPQQLRFLIDRLPNTITQFVASRLKNLDVSDEVCQRLAERCPNLTSLELNYISPEGLNHLLNSQIKLKNFKVKEGTFDTPMLNSMAKCWNSLISLKLPHLEENVGADTIKTIFSQLKKLRTLYIRLDPAQQDFLIHISQSCPRIKGLHIESMFKGYRGTVLPHLKHLTRFSSTFIYKKDEWNAFKRKHHKLTF